jgi:hypothetical protein
VNGLQSWTAWDFSLNKEVGVIGIAGDGIYSALIHEADGTSGQDTNSGYGIKTGHIQDAAVNLPKIKWEVWSTKIARGQVYIRTFRRMTIIGMEWGSIPVFFGRPAFGTSDNTWDLSDFATAFRRDDGTYWREYWIIKNVTGYFDGDRELRIVVIVNPASSQVKSKFFLQYHAENGEIMNVTKTEQETPLEELPQDVKWHLLDNHPLREQIYEHPSDFIVDIRTGKIIRRS